MAKNRNEPLYGAHGRGLRQRHRESLGSKNDGGGRGIISPNQEGGVIVPPKSRPLREQASSLCWKPSDPTASHGSFSTKGGVGSTLAAKLRWAWLSGMGRDLCDGAAAGTEPDLTGELGQLVPSLHQPPVLLLQELPLLTGVTAFLQEPVVLLLVLQQLEHGLLQLLAE